MNRTELERTALAAASRCMKAKHHVALVDVFQEMGKLSRDNHEAWRRGRAPYLERVIELNLAQINAVCRAIHASAQRGRLKPSWTAYVKWGNGARSRLRFTKSDDPHLERLWATHYLHPSPSPVAVKTLLRPQTSPPQENERHPHAPA